MNDFIMYWHEDRLLPVFVTHPDLLRHQAVKPARWRRLHRRGRYVGAFVTEIRAPRGITL